LLLAFAYAAAGTFALPASTAIGEEAPPIVTGPLTSPGHDCYTPPSGTASHCVYLYVLDPGSTGGGRTWRAYWATDRSVSPAATGSCITASADALTWFTGSRPGPAPRKTYPSAGTRPVAAGTVARLLVDAGGKASKPGLIRQRSRWKPGTVTATVQPGRFVVLWEGRTTGAVPFTLGAEVADPGSEFGLVGATNLQLDAPCAHVPAPGPGFLALIEPQSVAPGQTAWLELRAPGVRPRVTRAGSFVWPEGTATVTISRQGATVFGPQSIRTVGGRYALPLAYPAGSYDVAVSVHGPTGTRQFQLAFGVG
jgi:hypothetical protein